MNKLITLLAVFFSSLAFSQFKVADDNWVKVGNDTFTKLLKKPDNTKARIEYFDVHDMQKQIQSKEWIYTSKISYFFEFSTDADTLDQLYNIIKKGLEEKKTEIITLEFPEGKMRLNFYKTLSYPGCTLRLEKKASDADASAMVQHETYPINLKHIDKIFGK